MLNSIFTILSFQLIGEFIQKFTEISIPGPVIGLILLLGVLLIRAKYFKEHQSIENNLVDFSERFLTYLPLLFIPVGVGVVMHLSLLEENLISVISIIVLGTLLTLALTGFIMEKFLKNDNQK